jgi:hypothetical protein
VYQNFGVKTYTNPSDASSPAGGLYNDAGWGNYGVTGYAANYQALGWWFRTTNNKTMRMTSVPDGTSNTVFFAEKTTVCLNNAIPSGYSGAKYNIWSYARTSWNEWNPVFGLPDHRAGVQVPGAPRRGGSTTRCDPRLPAPRGRPGIWSRWATGAGGWCRPG